MDQTLDAFLWDRCRWLVPPQKAVGPPGEFVLYWMHHALRAHDNPALDVAVSLAAQNGLPMVVYHGLSETYPYASDRLHAFTLQGHRDVARELDNADIARRCQIDCVNNRRQLLAELTRRAAVLVTEEMPTEPLTGWLDRLRQTTRTPIAVVDTHCLLPSRVSADWIDPEMHVSQFRDRTWKRHWTAAGQTYPTRTLETVPVDDEITHETFDLERADLSRLIGQCDIDHSIPPIRGFCGGSRAGYQRWNTFREHHLQDYHRRRDDYGTGVGTSRISAYVHYGMVSPFRIARETITMAENHPRARPGCEKFLDQFLTWREMAFHFCVHLGEQFRESLDTLPRWARATLDHHAHDPRDHHLVWEDAARGRSGSPSFDAAQRSLLHNGELHNRLRMSWCKSLIAMTRTPAEAYQMAIDLNNRYAVDGRDPNSYCGVRWCFGQFERPRDEDTPIFGTVRRRDDESDAAGMDLINMNTPSPDLSVAIVGAGLGGLAAANALVDQGIDVTMFEKSGGVGGRLATRRVNLNDTQVTFDHGAQYFTVRDDRFRRYVESWQRIGLVDRWMDRIVELDAWGRIGSEKDDTARYVGVPSINSIAKHMAKGIRIHRRCHVTELIRGDDERYQIRCNIDASAREPNVDLDRRYDAVILNPPPVQTLALVRGLADWDRTVAECEMVPCIAMMLQLHSEPPVYAGAFINDGPLRWIARDDSKPGRTQPNGSDSLWMVHAGAQWSARHIDDDPAALADPLTEAFRSAIGHNAIRYGHRSVHRWRYSAPKRSPDSARAQTQTTADPPDTQPQTDCLWDAAAGLAACGDWLNGGRVEGAFLSGHAAAGAIMRHHTIDRPA